MATDKNVIVHGATLADKPELWRLFRLAHSEAGMYPLDEDAVNEFIDGALRPKDKQGIIAVVRGEDKEIRAYMLLLLTRIWYSNKFHLEEVSNFVAPEHRKSNYADALIRYAQHAARQLAVPLVIG